MKFVAALRSFTKEVLMSLPEGQIAKEKISLRDVVMKRKMSRPLRSAAESVVISLRELKQGIL